MRRSQTCENRVQRLSRKPVGELEGAVADTGSERGGDDPDPVRHDYRTITRLDSYHPSGFGPAVCNCSREKRVPLCADTSDP